MDYPKWFERHTGAYATPRLVGRTNLLNKMRGILENPGRQLQIVFIKGQGGIGKTRLVNETLEIARQMQEDGAALLAARTNVDMYHVTNHTSNGLAHALYEVLSPPSEPFLNYESEHRILARMWLAGEVSDVTEHMQTELQAFIKDMTTICKEKRIVIILDTAEKMFYGDPKARPEIAHLAESWKWLVSVLPRWENVLLVVAGRPEVAPLAWELGNIPQASIINIDVDPFGEGESLEYFEAAQQAALDGKDEATAERIRLLPAETRLQAHRRSEGRPILLALLVDFMTTIQPGQLHTTLNPMLYNPADLEKELISRLRETPRLGDTIVALGRLPKGADAELLADVLHSSVEDAQKRLEEIKQFSFAKTRPSDERVFLHDEMYAFLGRQVYSDLMDLPEADRAGRAIMEYYKKQNSLIRSELNELYAPVEVNQRDRLDLLLLAEAHDRRQALLAEITFYRLRQNAVKGYMRCYRYMREAVLSGELLQYIQFQVEMQAFLLEKDAQGAPTDLDGLGRDLLVWELSLFSTVQAWINRDYKQVLEQVSTIRKTIPAYKPADTIVKTAVLDVWEGSALHFLGGANSFPNAIQRFSEAINQIEQLHASDPALPEALRWQASAALASAYRMRGYVQRIRGLMQQAVEDYRRAAAELREIDLRIELAFTLNDMGFALAELGQWADARALVKDALEMRRYLGPRSPVALSLNTLAMIDIKEGSYKAAIEHAESGLGLARALGHKRGLGLSLIALAEAQRRHSGSDQAPTIDEKISLLRAARDHAQDALKIFRESGETIRQAEALIEVGCACRDWVHLRKKHHSARDDVGRLMDDAKRSLRDAAEVAGDAILYKKLDALVNLAWLGYYAGDEKLIDEASSKVEMALPKSYLIDPSTGKPAISEEEAQRLVWPHIGKLEVLRGHQAYDHFLVIINDGVDLKPAIDAFAERYFWGLQYSALYSENYEKLTKVKDEIYEKIKIRHSIILRIVAQKVIQLEKQNHIKTSAMRLFLTGRALWYGNGS